MQTAVCLWDTDRRRAAIFLFIIVWVDRALTSFLFTCYLANIDSFSECLRTNFVTVTCACWAMCSFKKETLKPPKTIQEDFRLHLLKTTGKKCRLSAKTEVFLFILLFILKSVKVGKKKKIKSWQSTVKHTIFGLIEITTCRWKLCTLDVKYCYISTIVKFPNQLWDRWK